MLLWTFIYKSLYVHAFLCHLGMYQGVELLGHMVTQIWSQMGEWVSHREKSRSVSTLGTCVPRFLPPWFEACAVLYESSCSRKKEMDGKLMSSNTVQAMATEKERQFSSVVVNSRSKEKELGLDLCPQAPVSFLFSEISWDFGFSWLWAVPVLILLLFVNRWSWPSH